MHAHICTTWVPGLPTHAGSQAEGLLPNARMIQGVFDDANAATRGKVRDANGYARDANGTLHTHTHTHIHKHTASDPLRDAGGPTRDAGNPTHTNCDILRDGNGPTSDLIEWLTWFAHGAILVACVDCIGLAPLWSPQVLKGTRCDLTWGTKPCRIH